MKTRGASVPDSVPTILLIDDHQQGLLGRELLLKQEGYKVIACNSPEDGLARLAEQSFDVVITKYRMRPVSGAEVIARVRALRPATAVIVISGSVDALGLNEANTGADAVIPKSHTEVSHLLRHVARFARVRAPRKPAARQCAPASSGARTVNWR